jgi:hypothetical protein
MASVASLQTQLDALQAQLHDLYTSMVLAHKVGNTAALEIFREQFKALSAKAAVLRAEISAADAPPELLVQLAQFSDTLTNVAHEVGADVSGLAKGAVRTVTLLPIFLGLLIVVVGIGFWRGSLRVSR